MDDRAPRVLFPQRPQHGSTPERAESDAACLRTGLAAFDFDGTLTWTDSFSLFLAYCAGKRRFTRHMLGLAPALAAALSGGAARDRAKALTCARFFSEMPSATATLLGEEFAVEILPLIVRGDGRARLAAARAEGLRPVIVSASLTLYLEPLAREWGVECLATGLAECEGRLTGAIDGVNCRGAEKVRRLQAAFGPGTPLVEAYGDSAGDHALLAAAEQGYWRPFRDRPPGARRALAAAMRRRGQAVRQSLPA